MNDQDCPDCWRKGDERIGCNCLSESSDSDQPLERPGDGALAWWAECFPQHKGAENA